MFHVSYGNTYSLSDIKGLQDDGVSVLRSAHIGNFNKATLLLAQAGFPVLLHEHLSGNAPIYEPAYIKMQGKKTLVSNNPDMPQLHDSSFPEDISMDGRSFQNPSQFHYHVLKRQFPNVFLSSDAFLRQRAFVERVLALLVGDFPSMFSKYQERDGSVLHFSHKTSDGITYGGHDSQKTIPLPDIASEVLNNFDQTQDRIKNQGNSPQGIIMHSLLYILLSTIAEIYRDRQGVQRFNPERVDVIHFSGTQMINYLFKNKKLAEENIKQLSAMYQKLQEWLRNVLPQEVGFHLVPTTTLPFLSAYFPENHKALDALLNDVLSIKRIEALRNEKRRECANILMEETRAMSTEEVMARAIYYRQNIALIPGSGKKKVSELEELCSHACPDKDKVIGLIVSLETTMRDLYANDDVFQSLHEEDKSVRSGFVQNLHPIEGENAVQITQYDLLKDNRALHIPEAAWNISFKDLEETLRRYGKDKNPHPQKTN